MKRAFVLPGLFVLMAGCGSTFCKAGLEELDVDARDVGGNEVVAATEAAGVGESVVDPAGAVGSGSDLFAGEIREPVLADDAGPSKWTGRLGLGFTSNPDTFLLGATGDRQMSEKVSIGPLILFGGNDKNTIFVGAFQARRMFDIRNEGDKLADIKPFLQGGAGVAYIDKPNRSGDTGFALSVGGGFDIPLDETSWFGSNILFNIMPGKVADEGMMFSWQVLTFTFTF